MKNRPNTALIIFLFALFSLVVYQGYGVFNSDHLVYIPAIYHDIDHSLFSNDLILSFNQTTYTFFDEMVVWFVNLGVNIFILFFILSLVVRMIYFLAIYRLSYYFTRNNLFSILSILLFIVGAPVYGTGLLTIDNNLVPRLISLALGLLAISFLLEKKDFLSATIIGFGLLIHPITLIPFLIIFYLTMFMRRDFSGLITKGIIPFVFLLPFFFSSGGKLMFFTVIDPLWESIIRFRDPYVFFSSWGFFAFLFMVISILLFLVLATEYRAPFKKGEMGFFFHSLFFIPLALLLLSIIAVDLFKLAFFAQLQLARSLILWEVIIRILFSFYAYDMVRKSPGDWFFNISLTGIIASFVIKEFFLLLFFPLFFFIWVSRRLNLGVKDSWSFIMWLTYFMGFLSMILFFERYYLLYYLAAVLLLSVLFLIIMIITRKIGIGKHLLTWMVILIMLAILIFLPGFSIYPKQYSDHDITGVCEWVAENTPSYSLFLVSPFSGLGGSFRLFCLRPVFADWKDGSQVVFDRDYAVEWLRRMDLINNVKNNNSMLKNIIDYENISYILSDHAMDTNFTVIFNNSEYYLYSLD